MPPSHPIISTYEFEVPNWLSVKDHFDLPTRWPGYPSPDMRTVCAKAASGRRLAFGTFELHKEQHPYMVSGPYSPYYAYTSSLDGLEHLGRLGRITRRYVFYKSPPDDITMEYEPPDSDESVIQMLKLEDESHVVNFRIGNEVHVTQVGEVGDAFTSVMTRATVILNIVRNTAGDTPHRALPYMSDAPQIAMTRVVYAMKWQFKNSRTKPLFA